MTAKEFYENQLHDKTVVVGRLEKDEIIELMQAYHEAKLRESKIIESFERENQYVTDEDIEAFADKFARADSNKSFERGEWLGIKEGVRAMRDGEIKHNREV